jgi:hypothetical protein
VGQGDDYGGFALAGVFPACGARLRVKINNDARLRTRRRLRYEGRGWFSPRPPFGSRWQQFSSCWHSSNASCLQACLLYCWQSINDNSLGRRLPASVALLLLLSGLSPRPWLALGPFCGPVRKFAAGGGLRQLPGPRCRGTRSAPGLSSAPWRMRCALPEFRFSELGFLRLLPSRACGQRLPGLRAR